MASPHSLQDQIKVEERHHCVEVFTAVKEEPESVNISAETDKADEAAVKEEAETADFKEEEENWTSHVNEEANDIEIGLRAESPFEIEVKLEPGSESEESSERESVNQSKGRKRVHPLQQPQHRKGLEVTDADFELLRSMTGTPISYLANQPPLLIAVGENTYPLGCGLSYQIPSMDTVSHPQDDA